jgi:hypothetical protein
MAGQDFDTIWIPPVGKRAAAEMRRQAYVGLAAGLAAIGLAVACSFLFGSGTPAGVLLGCVAAALAAAAFVSVIRGRMKVAAALSFWFGREIRWSEMPRMQPAAFDAWCEKKGLQRPEREPYPGNG